MGFSTATATGTTTGTSGDRSSDRSSEVELRALLRLESSREDEELEGVSAGAVVVRLGVRL